MPSLPETIPTIEELALDRPPCEEIGHPEQMQGRHFAGLYPIHRLLCGDTPDFGAPLGRRPYFWLPLFSSLEVPPPCHPPVDNPTFLI